MSFKAKDLTYESNEPAFLRRLRGQVAGGDADRHERPIARPKRLKQNDDEDDGPTYVVEESGDTLSKAEYEAMLAKEDAADETVERPEGEAAEGGEPRSHSRQQLAEAGQKQKKRKAAKIIGNDDEKDEAVANGHEEQAKKVTKKPKKKAKAVKLSFEDE